MRLTDVKLWSSDDSEWLYTKHCSRIKCTRKTSLFLRLLNSQKHVHSLSNQWLLWQAVVFLSIRMLMILEGVCIIPFYWWTFMSFKNIYHNLWCMQINVLKWLGKSKRLRWSLFVAIHQRWQKSSLISKANTARYKTIQESCGPVFGTSTIFSAALIAVIEYIFWVSVKLNSSTKNSVTN